nr:uncharacterized protein CTRU02_11248 [Colletotrichum truncatum]KAF6785990.1 hypothetical protein CTRU02_11248 [Colletotrichum truncatum]
MSDLVRKDGGLQSTIRITDQSYDTIPDCWHRTSHTRRLILPEFLFKFEGIDSVSLGLRDLGSRLEELSIRVITHNLFRSLSWLHMKHLKADMFHILPATERTSPLLLVFALSLQRQNMPSLQDTETLTWLLWRPSKERARKKSDVAGRYGLEARDEVIKALEDLVAGNGENMDYRQDDIELDAEEVAVVALVDRVQPPERLVSTAGAVGHFSGRRSRSDMVSMRGQDSCVAGGLRLAAKGVDADFDGRLPHP